MIRGTTPPIALEIEGYNLSGKTVEVYIKDGGGNTLLTKTDDDLAISWDNEASVIQFRLSQEETLGLPEGTVRIQVRWIGEDGIALATDMVRLPVDEILKPEVIEYREGEDEDDAED